MDRTTSILIVGLTVCILTAFVVLALAGRDTTSLALLLAGPAVSALVGALLVKRTAAVGADVAVVRHQTNTLLTDHLNVLGDQLAAAHSDRVKIADDLRRAQPTSAALPVRPVPDP